MAVQRGVRGMSALGPATFRGFIIRSTRSGEYVGMKDGAIVHRARSENALYTTIENATRRKGKPA